MLNTGFIFKRFSSVFSIACFLISIHTTPLTEGLSEDVLKYTNQFRRSKGLAPLVMRDDLNAIARSHSEDMAKRRCSIGHSGYNKRELKVRKIISPFYGMAENVAYGARNGKDVVSLWKKSSGHRRNLLGNYKFIGIGTARDRRGEIYYTQIFVR